MPVFGRRVDGPEGKRRSERERVVLAAAAQAIHGSRSVVIADISTRGAKLQGRDLPPCGRQILLGVGTVELLVTIAWRDLDECGVRFDPPLNTALVRKLKQEGSWAKVMGIEEPVQPRPVL